MSELSDKIRSEFKKSDDERDALMNTPEDVDRWDNIVYGHDDREIQKLDVYRPKQARERTFRLSQRTMAAAGCTATRRDTSTTA